MLPAEQDASANPASEERSEAAEEVDRLVSGGASDVNSCVCNV